MSRLLVVYISGTHVGDNTQADDRVLAGGARGVQYRSRHVSWSFEAPLDTGTFRADCCREDLRSLSIASH